MGHLIIDREAVGDRVWSEMKATIRGFIRADVAATRPATCRMAAKKRRRSRR
jgi:hypothetical protein